MATNVKFLNIKTFFNQSFGRIVRFQFDQNLIIPDILKNCNLFQSNTLDSHLQHFNIGKVECYRPSVGHIGQPDTRRNFQLIKLFSKSTCNKNTKIWNTLLLKTQICKRKSPTYKLNRSQSDHQRVSRRQSPSLVCQQETIAIISMF